MKNWIITDTHFFHANIVKYENRPLDFNEQIIANWKALVSKEDTVYHLGDVIFKRQGLLGSILEELPGQKILIKGNHDGNADGWFVRKGFESVHQYYVTDDGILLSHSPLDIDKISAECGKEILFNIHGHFHRKNREEMSRSILGYPFYSKKHLLLSIEDEDYKPVLMNEFIQRYI